MKGVGIVVWLHLEYNEIEIHGLTSLKLSLNAVNNEFMCNIDW
jgi:hypothetical protein